VDNWDLEGLREQCMRVLLVNWDYKDPQYADLKHDQLHDILLDLAKDKLAEREQQFGAETMEKLERYVILRVIDERWKEHLYEMDQIKEGIGLRAYGQKDPLIEYKKEAFSSFVSMLDRINEEALQFIFRAQVETRKPVESPTHQQLQTSHASADGMGYSNPQPQADGSPAPNQPAKAGKKQPVKVAQRVGRNDPCPCGGGKKYKKCCGAN